MSRHTAYIWTVGIVIVAMVVGLTAMGYAQQQEERFSVQWQDISVSNALAALQRQFGIQYVLPGALGSRTITVVRDDVTPQEALQELVAAAGLTAVNQNGVWHIQEASGGQEGGRSYRGGAGAVSAAPPMPYRTTPGDVNVGGAYGSPQLGVRGLQPSTTGRTGFGMAATEQYSPEDMIFRIVPLNFVDPYLVTQMFGGNIVGGDQGGYGQQGGYGGRGGYGQSGYGGRGGYGQSGYDRGSYGRDYGRGSSSYGRGSYGGDYSGYGSRY